MRDESGINVVEEIQDAGREVDALYLEEIDGLMDACSLAEHQRRCDAIVARAHRERKHRRHH